MELALIFVVVNVYFASQSMDLARQQLQEELGVLSQRVLASYQASLFSCILSENCMVFLKKMFIF